jgi:hypothetical protein
MGPDSAIYPKKKTGAWLSHYQQNKIEMLKWERWFIFPLPKFLFSRRKTSGNISRNFMSEKRNLGGGKRSFQWEN